MTNSILVYIELNNNQPLNITKEIISKLHNCNNNMQINGVVITDLQSYELSKNILLNIGLDNLYVINDSIFDSFQTCIYSDALVDFLKQNNPDIFLMGATEKGRELAPRTASALDIGLTADCTDITITADYDLLATRPTYGGKMMATIVSKTKPNFATIRPGAFKISNFPSRETNVVFITPDLSGEKILTNILKCENKIQKDDWTCAEIIVSGGLGLKTKENFELIYKLSELLNAKPAASRGAVEMGWAPESIQVGQTGSSVSPKLYLAFGISGAMQHIVGITNSDRIIAINTDKSAPIMNSADVAIVADAVSVLNQMILKYK